MLSSNQYLKKAKISVRSAQLYLVFEVSKMLSANQYLR